MTLTFSDNQPDAIPMLVLCKSELEKWQAGLTDTDLAWAKNSLFAAAVGEVLVMPTETGSVAMAVVGLGDEKAAKRGRFLLAKARGKLPAGVYRLVGDLKGEELEEAALGWLLAGYRFDRYSNAPSPKAQLLVPSGVSAAKIEAIAAGEALTRNLINTPASDMGPDDLQAVVEMLVEEYECDLNVISDDAVVKEQFPMIHAVGRAADRAPRLIDFSWGTSGPRLTLVGKGVCFDSGGLNIKPGASMGLMKKDMGGAATVLGLAQMIMALKLKVQLRILIPAVENSISGNAFRPSDILTSRKGLTVEINNTDAEGRLVLADALTLADEDRPDLIISIATLTGAARVAVGSDLAPFYSTDNADASAIETAAQQVRDPVWRMPFWDPYEPQIEPGIADLDNAPKGGMAGSITAALFLRRFVTNTPRYLHFDIYGWQPVAAPARPKGGVGQGARAIFAALPKLLGI